MKRAVAVRVAVFLHAVNAVLDVVVPSIVMVVGTGALWSEYSVGEKLYFGLAALLSALVVYAYLSRSRYHVIAILLLLAVFPRLIIPIYGAYIIGAELNVSLRLIVYTTTSIFSLYAAGYLMGVASRG